MSKASYLLKNMWVLTISNFSSKILIFLLVPLYTSVLSTEEYGKYDLAVSTATLLYPLLTLNIVDAVMRFLMDKNSDRVSIATIGLRFISISSIIFGIIMLVINITGICPQIYGLEKYIFAYYISYAFNQFFIQFAKGLEKVNNLGVAGILSTVVTILSQITSALYLAIKVKIVDYVDLKCKAYELTYDMLKYSIPLIATVIGWWINSTADKYVVVFMLGTAANGLLSVSYKIPQILNTFQGIFTQAWQISAIKEYGEDDTSTFYGKTFSTINILMCIVCAGLIILTRPLAHILYARDFYAAWRYVPFLLVSSVINCASGLLGPILSAKKDSKAMMLSALVGAGVNIILNIALVYAIGIQGATIATVICSYIIYAVRKKAVGKDIYIKNYYIVILTWSILFIQSIVESYFANYIIEIILIIVMLIINANQFKQLIYMMKKLVYNFRK